MPRHAAPHHAPRAYGHHVFLYRAVSYPTPFGGVEGSGLGRENGIGAVRAYPADKSVWINTGAPTGNPFVMR